MNNKEIYNAIYKACYDTATKMEKLGYDFSDLLWLAKNQRNKLKNNLPTK